MYFFYLTSPPLKYIFRGGWYKNHGLIILTHNEIFNCVECRKQNWNCCTVITSRGRQHSAPTSNASVLPSAWARKQKQSCTVKPDETNVVAPSSRLIAALLGHAGSWYMHSSPKRNRRAEGLSIKWITHHQLTYWRNGMLHFHFMHGSSQLGSRTTWP